jgi:peptide/nickel transport system substrate-binding protein
MMGQAGNNQEETRMFGHGLDVWRRPVALIVAGALALVTLALPMAGSVAGPASDTATILQGADVISLEPYFSQNLPDTNVVLHIFERLTQYTEDLRLIPGLAESWRLRDARTWEFKITPGRKFQNGEPLNAEAVRFSLMRGKEFFEKKQGDVSYLYNLLDLDIVEVVDEYTVRIKTKNPNPLVPQHMAHEQTAVVPPRYTSQTPMTEITRRPIGSGPYRVVEFVPNERVVLEVWSEHPNRPRIRRLLWRPVPETATRLAEMAAGNADIAVNVPPDLISQVERGRNARVEAIAGLRRIIIGLRQDRHPALRDKRVRQAFNYAFDCQTLMKNLLAGRGECTGTVANVPDQNPSVKPYPYDLRRAAALLDEADWRVNPRTGIREQGGRPLELGMDCPRGRYIKDAEICQVVAADLTKIGVKVDLQIFDWSVFSTKAQRRGAGFRDIYLIGSGPGFDCQADLALVQKDSGSNRSLFESARFEELWDQISVAFDPKKRREICYRMQEVLHDEAPVVFIWFQTDLYAVSERLTWKPRSDERILLHNARFR